MSAQSKPAPSYPAKSSALLKVLRVIGVMLPTDGLRTWVYLNLIDAPRRFLRLALLQFYRYDHVYAVIREFKRLYGGRFSILEFGTSDGYSFTKILYATHYLKMEDRITVHAFDSFEGLPPAAGASDIDVVNESTWVAGEYKGRYESLDRYCRSRFHNYRIHKGYFEHSLTPEVLAELQRDLPMLVWMDCDYYSSARTVWERVASYLPNGCVIYFDDLEAFNFGSRFTGEARLVHEINTGVFGQGVELVPDTQLSLTTRSIYRFLRFPDGIRYPSIGPSHSSEQVHRRGNNSPLP